MTNKLLPCPFCGGEAEKMTSSDGFTSIGCLRCNPAFGVMVQRNTEAEAITAWNTRAERTCLNEYGRCSVCNAIMYDTPNYCSNCGAKVVN